MRPFKPGLSVVIAIVVAGAARADGGKLRAEGEQLAAGVDTEVIADRRWFHEHPELGNREIETGRYIAEKLRGLGYEVQTGAAHTGVVAVLRGGRPGPVVALRSDMDALPVVEQTDLPFASKVRTNYDGQDVGVMHACGHDTHMGMLLGAARVFAKLKGQLPGTVKLIFQPAEEGAPSGEDGGGELMVREGVLSREPKPEAIFGLHVLTQYETGTLAYRPGALMASADDVAITVKGRSTHGAMPWNGVDPIVVAAQIVLGLQTITSRQMDLTKAPTVVTIGRIEGGTRNNIIPDAVTMKGTLRALDEGMRDELKTRVARTAENIATSAGATAEVSFAGETHYPVTVNDPKLTARMLPTLRHVAGEGLKEVPPALVAEDFSYYGQQIPALFVFIGVRKPGASADDYAPNHSPRFRVDEAGLALGLRTLVDLTLDYMSGAPVH